MLSIRKFQFSEGCEKTKPIRVKLLKLLPTKFLYCWNLMYLKRVCGKFCFKITIFLEVMKKRISGNVCVCVCPPLITVSQSVLFCLRSRNVAVQQKVRLSTKRRKTLESICFEAMPLHDRNPIY